jgi:hypothetical protein
MPWSGDYRAVHEGLPPSDPGSFQSRLAYEESQRAGWGGPAPTHAVQVLDGLSKQRFSAGASPNYAAFSGNMALQLERKSNLAAIKYNQQRLARGEAVGPVPHPEILEPEFWGLCSNAPGISPAFFKSAPLTAEEIRELDEEDRQDRIEENNTIIHHENWPRYNAGLPLMDVPHPGKVDPRFWYLCANPPGLPKPGPLPVPGFYIDEVGACYDQNEADPAREEKRAGRFMMLASIPLAVLCAAPFGGQAVAYLACATSFIGGSAVLGYSLGGGAYRLFDFDIAERARNSAEVALRDRTLTWRGISARAVRDRGVTPDVNRAVAAAAAAARARQSCPEPEDPGVLIPGTGAFRREKERNAAATMKTGFAVAASVIATGIFFMSDNYNPVMAYACVAGYGAMLGRQVGSFVADECSLRSKEAFKNITTAAFAAGMAVVLNLTVAPRDKLPALLKKMAGTTAGSPYTISAAEKLDVADISLRRPVFDRLPARQFGSRSGETLSSVISSLPS